MGLGKTVQVCSYLGAMALSRKLRSILIIAPATMLMHWINELKIWAPGLRRILMHKSVERPGDPKRVVTKNLLLKLDKWLAQARADRVNEAIDEKDLEEHGDDSFCGTGYVVITTFENIRRSSDIWVGHKWSYVVLDEGQKVRLFWKFNQIIFVQSLKSYPSSKRSEIRMQKLQLHVNVYVLLTGYFSVEHRFKMTYESFGHFSTLFSLEDWAPYQFLYLNSLIRLREVDILMLRLCKCS
jgi:SNF2 family DNA or RNA helicase